MAHTHMSDWVDRLYINAGIRHPKELTIDRLAYIFRLRVAYLQINAFRYNKTVVLNTNHDSQSQRFSFYHELAHVLRHTGVQRYSVPPMMLEWQEWDAKRFTYYAAMPTYLIEKYIPMKEGAIFEAADLFDVPIMFARKRMIIYQKGKSHHGVI